LAPERPPSAIPWPPLLLVTAAVAAFLLGRARPLPWPGLDDLPARVIGYGLGIGGIVLIGWSLIELRRHRTTVRPDAAATTLVTSGPFRVWRNPIYMGDVLILLGLAQALLDIWFVILAVVFALALLPLAILPEERHLEARFGAEYLDYKARTRRWF
jgi:protein-S-isoprenylcysteine O-methyltransferase Ste14